MRIDFDIRAELEVFPWIRARWYADRLVAASPFRYDQQPSFRVDLTHGYWTDSGANDPEWERGGIVRLLSFLRDETVPETLDYLRAKYGQADDGEEGAVSLRVPTLTLPEPYCPLPESTLAPYQWRHPYLAGRGITEGVQRLCGVGYDRDRQAVVIPIRNANGTLGNVKFRRVDSKTFWYANGGRPIRESIFGIDIVYKRGIKRAAIVEAEIDAMTVMSAGVPAIATCGAHFNEVKAELIRASPLEEIVIIRDNDAAGRKWQREIIRSLKHDVKLTVVTVPGRFKDVNEAGAARMGALIERGRRIQQIKISVKGA